MVILYYGHTVIKRLLNGETQLQLQWRCHLSIPYHKSQTETTVKQIKKK